MNRLLKDCLKDCLNSSCCKKEENVCDIIDCLDDKIKEIDCNNKIIKEINKAIKIEDAKVDEKIKELKDELAALLDKFNKEKWVVGEYKWMPVGSKMPQGWVKVDLGKGLTLVQGDEEGETSGDVKKHRHSIQGGKCVWIFNCSEIRWMNKAAGAVSEGNEVPFLPTNSSRWLGTTPYVDYEGSDNNLAAGKNAELWQFKGVDHVKDCLKNSLQDQINKWLEDFDNIKKGCEK